jgi:hypothetical protein
MKSLVKVVRSQVFGYNCINDINKDGQVKWILLRHIYVSRPGKVHKVGKERCGKPKARYQPRPSSRSVIVLETLLLNLSVLVVRYIWV